MRRVLKLFARAVMLWQSCNAPRLAAALAFYTVLSLAPLLIIAVGVASFFLSQENVQAGIIEQVGNLVGPSNEEVTRLLNDLFRNAFSAYQTRQGVIALLIGFGALLFGASLVFVELRAALNIIWEVPPAATAREGVVMFLKNRVISVAMVLGIGFLLLVSLVLTTAIAAFSRFLSQRLFVPLPLVSVFEAVVSTSIVALFFALLYKYVPSTKVAWRDTWLGAVLTALLFTVGRWLIGLYLGNSAIGSAYGTAGSLVIFLLWVYYSAQIFFFGAAFCRAQALRRPVRAFPSES